MDSGSVMFICMEERTVWNEDESRVIHLHGADINGVVKIEYKAVSAVYHIQDLRSYRVCLLKNEPAVKQFENIWNLPYTTG